MGRKTPKMARIDAEFFLGLSGSYDYKAFRTAVREATKKHHPDAGGDAEMMKRVNAAKDTLEYYFADDKTAVFTAATDAQESDEEFYRNEEAARQAAREADKAEEAEKAKEEKAATAPADDAGSSWTSADWDNFWQAANSTPANEADDTPEPAPESTESKAGPAAERAAAKKAGDWWTKSQNYRRNVGDVITTPYGYVSATKNGVYTLERSGWKDNVGVPFAYAATGDYDSWLEMNLEAQMEAIRTAGANFKPVASYWGWTGLEFLRPEDRSAAWIADLGLYVPDTDCSKYACMPDSIGVWELHPESPAQSQHIKVDLPDHKAENDMRRQKEESEEGMNPIARLVYDHLGIVSWLIIIALYFASMIATPYMLGFPIDMSFEDMLRQMDPATVIEAFLCEYTLPIAAFVFRKKIRQIIGEACLKSGKK